MERFVFVAAVTVAVIFGVAAVFGGGRLSFDFDEAGAFGTAELVEVAPGTLAAATFAGDRLRIRNAAARVTIVAEDRQDFSIEIDNSAGRAPMPEISIEANRVTIDGRLRGRIDDCRPDGGAELAGYGDLGAEDLPLITIRAPRNLTVDRNGAGLTEIGPTESLSLDFSGCSSATIGDVAGELEVDLSGSGDIRAGAAGSLNADIAGSGDLLVAAVSGEAEIDVAGSGGVTIGSLNGALSADTAGSGAITIQGGEVTSADIDVAGSSTVTVAALTGDLSADAAGSGSIAVEGGAVGSAEIDLAGSADVRIAAPVARLEVTIVGSGGVDVDGVVGELDVEIAGSGDVNVSAVTGPVRRQILGSGGVNIGD